MLIKFIADIASGRGLSSNVFVFDWLVIYNYYDYFPVYYSIIVACCVNRLLCRQSVVYSLFIAVICTLFIVFSFSRLAQILLLLLPANVLLAKILTSRRAIFGYATFLLVLVFCLSVILPGLAKAYGFSYLLPVRFHHWYSFFYSMHGVEVFFPISNEYRLGLADGTLHNELVEIYSYFGILTFFYYLIIFRYLASFDAEYRLLSLSLITVVTVGGFFQNNLSSTYMSMVIGIMIFVFSRTNRMENK